MEILQYLNVYSGKNKQRPIKDNLKNVIYEIPCSCNDTCIGKNGIKLATRIKEHKDSTRLMKTQNSAIAEHATSTGHRINWEKTRIIDTDKFWKTRNIKESFHISNINPSLNRNSRLESLFASRLNTLRP
ncbi:uncharacterized protein LOC143222618 [Tachypleus tridentatus]|uniref:uncharacterized protein LOC143222618 n=1 Tax=Tachypleus tridentatus TaxID=6853 RepID=UPI003FD577E6